MPRSPTAKKEMAEYRYEVHRFSGMKNKRIFVLSLMILTAIIVAIALTIVLTGTLKSSTSKSSTGFMVLPPGDITFNPEDPSSYEEYIALLNNTIEGYEQEVVTENMINCNQRHPEPGQVCYFRDTWLNQCRKASLWGYKQGRPCIILTFSNDSDFMPEISGGPREYPEQIPEDLKEEFEHTNARVGVHCTNAYDYNPYAVFNEYFFLNKNVTGYLPPLVAVTFDLQGKEVLEIQCTLWDTASSESISAHSFRIKRSS